MTWYSSADCCRSWAGLHICTQEAQLSSLSIVYQFLSIMKSSINAIWFTCTWERGSSHEKSSRGSKGALFLSTSSSIAFNVNNKHAWNPCTAEYPCVTRRSRSCSDTGLLSFPPPPLLMLMYCAGADASEQRWMFRAPVKGNYRHSTITEPSLNILKKSYYPRCLFISASLYRQNTFSRWDIIPVGAGLYDPPACYSKHNPSPGNHLTFRWTSQSQLSFSTFSIMGCWFNLEIRTNYWHQELHTHNKDTCFEIP